MANKKEAKEICCNESILLEVINDKMAPDSG